VDNWRRIQHPGRGWRATWCYDVRDISLRRDMSGELKVFTLAAGQLWRDGKLASSQTVKVFRSHGLR